MQWLKTNFLRLSIHRQIQVGILTVSFCVFFLVIALISINSFILINISYTDLITLLDNRDNIQIQGIQTFISLQTMITSDIIKDNLQYARNLIDNLQRNRDFLDPLISNNFQYQNYIRYNQKGGNTDCKNDTRNCFVYHNFTEETNETIKMKYIMASSIIMINYTLNSKLYQNPSYSLSNQISYLSHSSNSLYVFPYSEITLDQTGFNNNFKAYSNSTWQYYKYYFSNISKHVIFNTINSNEFLDKIVYSPFTSELDFNPSLDTTKNRNSSQGNVGISIKYSSFPNSNDTEVIRNHIQSPGEILDFLSLENNQSSIDLYFFDLTTSYRGVKVFLQTVNENKDSSILITPKTCDYFNFLYYLNNPDLIFTVPNYYSNILSCFPFDTGRYMLDTTFINSTYDNYYVKRRVKIPAINSYKDKSVNNAIYYKVFKSLSPDPYIYSMVNSDYFSLKQTHIYVFKNEEFMKRVNNQVYYNFVGVMFFVLFFNFLFWYLLLFFIYILLFKVTRSLTKPINLLCKLIKSIGKEETEEEKEAWNFAYSEDNDIKELFDMCRNLIKGGFSDSYSRLKEKRNENFLLNNAYNNISYVKTNNLIIEEDKIDKSSSFSAETIFNYKRNLSIENNIPFQFKEENIYSDPSKETGLSLKDNSVSNTSKRTKQTIKFRTKTHYEVFLSLEEIQRKEEKEYLLFDLFKNADLRICSFEKDY